MKQTLVFIIFLLVIHGELRAQVTIGSTKKPNSGALLDLKQDDNTFEPGVTATKGLGLPRVILTDLKVLTIGPEDDQHIIPNSNGAWGQHTGLLVYNIGDDDVCSDIPDSGLYVWTGTEWELLDTNNRLSAGVEVFTDRRDGEQYLSGYFGPVAGTWMLENLRFDPVLHPTTGFENFVESAAKTTEKQFYYAVGKTYQPPLDLTDPAYDWTKIKKYGIFYNWSAAVNGQNTSVVDQGQGSATEGPINTIQGICPAGWHLPSDKEWNELEKEIYQNPDKYSVYTKEEVEGWIPWDPAWETAKTWRPTVNVSDAQGSAMKYPCPPLGSNQPVKGESSSTKKGHFNVLMIGRAGNSQAFFYGENAHFITASRGGTNSVYSRIFSKDYAEVNRGTANDILHAAVRCKKNEPGIMTDKDLFHIASGHDARGTSVGEVIAKITNDYANKPITVEITTHPTLGGISFNPSLLTSLPAQAVHNYKMQAEPLPTPSASSPWKSKETYLTIKSTNDKMQETKRVITLNQTNYALKIGDKYADFLLPIAYSDSRSISVTANTKWKATVNSGSNVINVTSDAGGEVDMAGKTSSSNFSFSLNTAAKKYDKATVTFSDASYSPKVAKDITVTL